MTEIPAAPPPENLQSAQSPEGKLAARGPSGERILYEKPNPNHPDLTPQPEPIPQAVQDLQAKIAAQAPRTAIPPRPLETRQAIPEELAQIQHLETPSPTTTDLPLSDPSADAVPAQAPKESDSPIPASWDQQTPPPTADKVDWLSLQQTLAKAKPEAVLRAVCAATSLWRSRDWDPVYREAVLGTIATMTEDLDHIHRIVETRLLRMKGHWVTGRLARAVLWCIAFDAMIVAAVSISDSADLTADAEPADILPEETPT